MKPLEVWTCQRAENLKKKSSKILKNNYAATMVSAALRQIIGGRADQQKPAAAAPTNCRRRRGTAGARLYLPPAIRLANSVDSFKVQLKTYLFAKAYPV